MDWSDNENENLVSTQPSRDMPPSESEDDTDYMHIISKTIKTNNFDLCEKPKPNTITKKENKKQKNIIKLNLFTEQTKIERKFNPRLPPPDKYKK
jgi:hypothetical protein